MLYIFLIMGNAGFISSTVGVAAEEFSSSKRIGLRFASSKKLGYPYGLSSRFSIGFHRVLSGALGRLFRF